jgi:hypothetical protein
VAYLKLQLAVRLFCKDICTDLKNFNRHLKIGLGVRVHAFKARSLQEIVRFRPQMRESSEQLESTWYPELYAVVYTLLILKLCAFRFRTFLM